MKHLKTNLTVLLCMLAMVAITGRVRAVEAPTFEQVYGLLRTNLIQMSEADLNRASVEGLIKQLKGLAVLADKDTSRVESATDEPLISQARVFDGAFAYIRLARVEAGLGKAFAAAWDGLGTTSKLKGLALDLRFADGIDYPAVAEVASCFVQKDQALFKVGESTVRSTADAEAITLPLALLVNAETTGAAEVLVAVLRAADAGLVIGDSTAGRAHPFREFPLSNGQVLKIASGTLELAGGKKLPDTRIVPDIRVTVPAAEEKALLEDAYRPVARIQNRLPVWATAPNMAGSGAATNRSSRRRLNEAELVRMQREGFDTNQDTINAPAEPPRPTIQDPVLNRALDFLKGMAVVQERK